MLYKHNYKKYIKKVPSKYYNYLNIFNKANSNKITFFYKNNNYIINLNTNPNKLSYSSFYKIILLKLEKYYYYIKNYLQYSFIKSSTISQVVPIIFIPKVNNSLYLYINYQKLNAIIVKNYYLLPLIKKIFLITIAGMFHHLVILVILIQINIMNTLKSLLIKNGILEKKLQNIVNKIVEPYIKYQNHLLKIII